MLDELKIRGLARAAQPEPSSASSPEVKPAEQPTSPTAADTPVESTQNATTATDPNASAPTTAENNDAQGDKKIKFSIGLDNIQSAAAPAGGGSGAFGVGGLGGSVETSGYVSDPALKQIGVVLTVFNNVPLVGKDNKYHLAYDSGLVGGSTGDLCGGRHSHPSCWDITKLEAVKEALPGENFKVGCSFMFTKWGEEYFNHYYPDLALTSSQICALRNNYLLNAEIIIPEGNTNAKALRVKIVDEGPNHKDMSGSGMWVIDMMAAYLMLNENKSLFSISTNSGIKNLNESEYTFSQAAGPYDYEKGEISGYSPTEMMSIATKKLDGESMIINGLKINNLQGTCRAKFYIEPSLRGTAENLIGKKLPDELFTLNATYGGGGGSVGSASLSSDGGNTLGSYATSSSVSPGADTEYIKALLAKQIVYSNPVLPPLEMYTNGQMIKGNGNKFWGTPNTKFGGRGVSTVKVNFPDGWAPNGPSCNVNTKIAERVKWVFHDIWKHYSQVQKADGSFYPLKTVKASAPGIFEFAGCKADRPMMGKNGKPRPGTISIHSWGAAFDFDAGNNGMSTKAPKARLSQEVYKPFFEIWYHYGFYSLGIEANYDWMHIQAFKI